MSETVKVVYNGSANRLIQAGPSGKMYDFVRGEAVKMNKKDAEWFLQEPLVAKEFDEPAPEPVSVQPAVGTFVLEGVAEVSSEDPLVSEPNPAQDE